MRKKLGAPSPALVISLVALFVALGGTSLAAASYINGKHIKPHSIPKNRLTVGAIKGLKGNRGPAGATGPAGAPGAAGPAGAPGVAGATNVVVRTQTDAPLPSGAFDVMAVGCNSGERAVGGGGGFQGNGGHEVIQQSYPVKSVTPSIQPAGNGDTPTGWVAIVQNNDTSALVPEVWVICASP